MMIKPFRQQYPNQYLFLIFFFLFSFPPPPPNSVKEYLLLVLPFFFFALENRVNAFLFLSTQPQANQIHSLLCFYSVPPGPIKRQQQMRNILIPYCQKSKRCSIPLQCYTIFLSQLLERSNNVSAVFVFSLPPVSSQSKN